MRNLLSNGAMIFAGMVSVPAIISTAHVVNSPSLSSHAPGCRPDPRLSLLDRFFSSSGAPARAFSHVFLHEADRYALDWRLLPSISFVETTGGKAARNNNLFGWDNGREKFRSMTDGIREVAHTLGTSTRYKDKDVDAVLEAYNPNPEYSRIVKSVMQRIAPEE